MPASQLVTELLLGPLYFAAYLVTIGAPATTTEFLHLFVSGVGTGLWLAATGAVIGLLGGGGGSRL